MRVKVMRIREMITIVAVTPVDDIARWLTEHRFGGLPVVDDKNQVIGIVTGSHLFLKGKGVPFSFFRIPRWSRRCVDSVQLMAQRKVKRVSGLHEAMLAKGEA